MTMVWTVLAAEAALLGAAAVAATAWVRRVSVPATADQNSHELVA
ncbi:hypothetical protein [Allosaccharopolyspora coralli]|nr:hypothetical protein [Allosaccharopolyspora coralli]